MIFKRRRRLSVPQSLRAFAEPAKRGGCKLDAEEKAALAESKAQVRRGEFATDEEVEAAYSRFRAC